MRWVWDRATGQGKEGEGPSSVANRIVGAGVDMVVGEVIVVRGMGGFAGGSGWEGWGHCFDPAPEDVRGVKG